MKSLFLSWPLNLIVPLQSPSNISVTQNAGAVLVSWQPLTLVEARGFVEYIVDLYLLFSPKRQILSTMRVPMNQSSVVFVGLDPNQAYEVSVGTETPSISLRGPVSARVLADTSSSGSTSITTIITAVSVVFLVTVLIVAISTVVIVLSRFRHSTLDFTKDLRWEFVVGLNTFYS